jgi:ATP-binding cassette, subfamily B, bacterial CvaB/MchF/RaxB
MRLIDRLQFGFSRKLPVYLQTQLAECGLMCIAMISAYHGNEQELSELRRRYRASVKGTSFEQLIKIAAGLGMTGRALRVDLSQLKQVKLPCVLHWDMGHFVVLESVKRNSIFIHDPSHGRKAISISEASERFTGAVLELIPNTDFGESPKTKRTPIDLSQMTGQVIGLKRSLVHIFLIGAAVEVITLVSPFFLQWVTDHAVVTGDRELLLALALGFGGLLIIKTVLEAVRGWAIAVMSTQFNIQWMANVFSHLLKLPTLYFERRHMGDIQSRFAVIQSVQNTMTVTYVEAWVDALMVVGTATMMCIYSPSLASVAVVAALLYVGTRFASYQLVREASNETLVNDAKQESMFMETIRGIVSLRLANREGMRTASWLNNMVRLKNSTLRQQRFSLVFQTVNAFTTGIARTIIIGLGALAVLDGKFSIGMLLAFLAYSEQFSSRASSLVDRLFSLRLLELQAMRLADIVFMRPEQDPKSLELPPLMLEASITLQSVRMRYADSEPFILDGCNLTVKPASITAIVGKPGSGKTTLMKTMMGLFPNHGGEVQFGGMPIKKLGLHNYRESVAGVLQDERLFAGSVAENLCFFAQTPDEDWLESCSKAVGLHDEVLQLPMRYQTLIGDLGTALSASQRQKLLLARAVYRRPQMLLIDEATSHLSVETEQAFLAFCSNQKMTVIYTTSRQQSLELASRICVLTGGKLFEQVPPATVGVDPSNTSQAAPLATRQAS